MCPSPWWGWWLAFWLGCCLADVAPMILRAHQCLPGPVFDHDRTSSHSGRESMHPSPGASASRGTFGNVQTSAPGLVLDRSAGEPKASLLLLIGSGTHSSMLSGTCLPASGHALGTCRHHRGRSSGSERPWTREPNAEWDVGPGLSLS